METKRCYKCEKELPLTTEFFHRGGKNSKLRGTCKECLNKKNRENKTYNIKKKERYYKYEKENKCTVCGSMINREEICKSVLCLNCWFKKTASKNLKNRKLWKELKQKFYEQNKKCLYSGKELIPGINASIDHILPRSIYKDRINDLNNVVWIDFNINRAKRNLSVKKFLELIEDIYHHSISKEWNN